MRLDSFDKSFSSFFGRCSSTRLNFRTNREKNFCTKCREYFARSNNTNNNFHRSNFLRYNINHYLTRYHHDRILILLILLLINGFETKSYTYPYNILFHSMRVISIRYTAIICRVQLYITKKNQWSITLQSINVASNHVTRLSVILCMLKDQYLHIFFFS